MSALRVADQDVSGVSPVVVACIVFQLYGLDRWHVAMRSDELTEDGIRQLVDAFYERVRADPQLAPIFARAIPGDWGPHLATMRDFWSSVMFTSGRYKGNPVAVHRRLDGMESELFDRWLALFGETCDELFAAPIAASLREKAARIAESLRLALFYRPDRPWPPGSAA